jgi:hypothetical protein
MRDNEVKSSCPELSSMESRQWGSGGKFHTFLVAAVHGDEWSASHPIHFISREEDPVSIRE